MSDPIIPPSHVHRIRYLKFNSLVWQTGFLWVTKIKKKSKSRHLLMIVLHRSYRISQTVLEDRPTPLSCQVVRPFLGVSHITAAMLRTITMNNLCLVGDRDITFRLDSSPVPVWTLGGISRVTLKNCFSSALRPTIAWKITLPLPLSFFLPSLLPFMEGWKTLAESLIDGEDTNGGCYFFSSHSTLSNLNYSRLRWTTKRNFLF